MALESWLTDFISQLLGAIGVVPVNLTCYDYPDQNGLAGRLCCSGNCQTYQDIIIEMEPRLVPVYDLEPLPPSESTPAILTPRGRPKA